MPLTPEQTRTLLEIERDYTDGDSFTGEEECLIRYLLATGWEITSPALIDGSGSGGPDA
jgi:hypothetical protein